MNRITKPTKLLDNEGKLVEAGWATEMLYEYDRNQIKAGATRIKEWDYYLIYNQSFAVALTIDDNSYMGLVSASVIDFTKPIEKTVSPLFLLPMGGVNFPSTSRTGDVKYRNKRVNFEFINHDGKRKLRAEIKNFVDKKDFICEFELTQEPKESMVIATPFEKEKYFYLNQKIVGFRAKGFAQVGDDNINFDPQDTFAILDWGRGVWTYKNTWYWSSAAGEIDGNQFGFNLGYGFGDTSKATENMLFYNGIAHKLDKVTFEISKKGDDLDFMSEWKFTSSDGRFEATFTPIIDRHSFTSALVISSNQHQVFGRFNGIAILDDGTKIELKDFLGFAEKVDNKW
ncbi:MAG: DUF2804 domain-containing protein [Clostridia bacterium]|nr:DUF2804 domain-containing protein [Clostridia bacterium]